MICLSCFSSSHFIKQCEINIVKKKKEEEENIASGYDIMISQSHDNVHAGIN